MATLLISDVAEQSGVPTSTLRYYERIGLLEPSGRSDNGYRIYDDDAVDRLRFIGRAKRLGMSLDQVAVLVKAWTAGECEPAQSHLRKFLVARIDELREHITQDVLFGQQLTDVLHGLGDGTMTPDRCGTGCGCDTDSVLPTKATHGGVISCSLGEHDLPQRVAEWRHLVATADRTQSVPGGFVAVFDPSSGAIGELIRLCVAETRCCPFFEFTISLTSGEVVFAVKAPPDAEDLIRRVFLP